MTPSNDPEAVLREILAAGARPQKIRNLRTIHELCRAQYDAGARDFSLSTIGKLLEAQEVMKGRGLYNEPAADYRRLIDSWGRLAGPAPAKASTKSSAAEDYVEGVADPAARMLLRSVIAERNRLQAQLNTLKGAKTVTVDRRPISDTGQQGAHASASLTDSERKALLKAIAPEFLRRHGWEELKFGEIVNERGRTIFDPGFAVGLRKLLGETDRNL
ncbi:gamma-mobile-trio protein GmtX [Mitsuaria sp. CC2]|uniref:gamma-mobile-trio protein GmtX n=1 Tax=Mitsuaria sp. CC2 TaxID=3029186 RepID=UPI003B8B0B59